MEGYNKEIFIKRLKMLRKEKNLTQPELGELIGKTKAAIGHYESGSREPNIESLYFFSSFFDVSIDYLIGISDFRNENDAIDYMFEKLQDAGLIQKDQIDKKTVDILMDYISIINKIKS